MKKLFLPFLLFTAFSLQAQVKIGDNIEEVSPYALLELESQNKGLILPRMSTAQRDAAFDQMAPEGLMIFNTDLNKAQVFRLQVDPSGRRTTKVWENAQAGIKLVNAGQQPPVNPISGQLYFDTALQHLFVWNGSSWIDTTAAATTPQTSISTPQSLTLSETILSISEGNSVDLAALALTGPQGPPGEEGPQGPTGPMGLAGAAGSSTDSQTLSASALSSANTLTLAISAGNTVTLDLSSLAGGSSTDSQTLSASALSAGATMTLAISEGNTITLDLSALAPLVDADGDTQVQVEETTDDDSIRFDTAGNERMRIDPNGRVGIGVSSPTYSLDINGTQRVVSYSENIYSKNTPTTTRTNNSSDLQTSPDYTVDNATIYTTFVTGSNVSNNQIIFETGGASVGTVLGISGGNFQVYAGSTSTVYISSAVLPNTAYSAAVVYDLTGNELRFYLTTTANAVLRSSDLVGTAVFTENDWAGSDDTGVGAANGDRRSPYGGSFSGSALSRIDLYTTNDIDNISTLSTPQGNYTRMLISDTGNVGIGIVTPTYSLSVNDQLVVGAYGNNQFDRSGGSNAIISSSAEQPGQLDIAFFDGNSYLNQSNFREIGRLRFGANEAIPGETPSNASLKEYASIRAQLSSSSGNGGNIRGDLVFATANSGTTTATSVDRMIVKANGRVGIGESSPSHILHINGQGRATNSAWATTSDHRIKQNITNYTEGLNVVLQLRPVHFQYNALSGHTDLNQNFVGVLAQEIEQVLPNTVTTIDDSEGKTGLSDLRLFDASELTFTLINAVKEQQQQIDALKALVEQLLAQQED